MRTSIARKVLVFLLSMATACRILAVPAFGAESRPVRMQDLDICRLCSITFSVDSQKVPIVGNDVQFFRVLDIDQHGGISPTEQFEACPDLRGVGDLLHSGDSADWYELSKALGRYATKNGLVPDAIVLFDDDGVACATDLEVGWYLALAGRVESDRTVYEFSPVPLAVPLIEAGAYVYDICGTLKYSSWTSPVNPGETLTRGVIKIWDDEGYEDARPDHVSVDLLRDGDVYDTVVLHDGNNWRHVWAGLPSNSYYAVVEDCPSEDCVTSIALEGTTFCIVNTYAGDIDDSGLTVGPGSGTVDPPGVMFPDSPDWLSIRSGIGGMVVGPDEISADSGNELVDGVVGSVLSGDGGTEYSDDGVRNSVTSVVSGALDAGSVAELEPLVDVGADGPVFTFEIELFHGTGPDGSRIPLANTLYPVISPPGRVVGWVEDGKGRFSVGPNEVFLVPMLPDGVQYEIREVVQPGWKESAVFNAAGTTREDTTSVVTIVNEESFMDGPPLPRTGGTGEVSFLSAGVAMLALAGLAYGRSRRKDG